MNDQFFTSNIILEDDTVKLEPMAAHHFPYLLPVALETDLWQFTLNQMHSEADFKKYFDAALEESAKGKSYAFVIYDKQTQRFCGSTRFLNIDFKHKRLEIGSTWIASYLHGKNFNRHCKFLLLQYCFETMQLNRVELKTSLLNLRSQKAMLNIGAVKEGIFRNHMINDDGSIRHSVFFSFIKEEWPSIKQQHFNFT
jgi:N-acetyltransferase